MLASEHSRLAQRAAIVTMATALFLISIKLVAWWLSGSMSILASLTDSLFDAGTSFINFIAIRIAAKPADIDHRFGHGKAEALSGLAQGAFITGSAILLLLRAVQQLVHPQPLTDIDAAVSVMITASVITAMLVVYQRRIVRRTGSIAVRGDMLHYQTDIMMNITVLLALLLTHWGWWWADGVLAISIVAYMLWAVRSVVYNALDHLMDKELPDEEREHILQLTRAHPQVIGCHDLRTRQSAGTRFIQMHIELDDQMLLQRANLIAHEVEETITTCYPDAEVIIHQDPISAVAEPIRDSG